MSDVRVLIVDDQAIIRQGIATMLKYAPGIEVVGQAANGHEAIARARELQPDVVLMDVIMPELGGIPATREIAREMPGVHIIILTTYDADELVFDGVRAGARSYLLKDVDGDRLAEAIRGVMRGEAMLDPKVASKVMAEFQRLAEEMAATAAPAAGAQISPLEPLTPREEDVLRLLVEGLANKEIGARLCLSEGTVKNHVSAIIAKLQANDRTDAVVTALRRGLARL
jgi:DNA-binding NarL/FixJ family response regulator